MTTANTAKRTANSLQATSRSTSGKGASRSLRREGKVPAVIYSKGKEPVSLTLTQNEVSQEYRRGRFRSRLIDITIDGKQSVKALPKDVQFHPVTDQIEHIDFIRIEPGVAIRVQIPVKFAGQDKSPGIKRGGVLNIVRHEIEFLAKPEVIPPFIEVSVAGLEIGGSVHISDIQLPEGVVPTIKRNFTVATVAGRSATMEEEVKPAATAEGAAAAEGAVPAEGAAAAPGAAPAAGAAPADAAKKDEGKKDAGKK